MQLEAKTEDAVNAVPTYGINAAFPECNGECWKCKYGQMDKVMAQAGRIVSTCTAGKINLQTVAPLSNLYAVRMGDERGEAAVLAKANGNRDPTPPDEQMWLETIRAQASSFGILADRRALEMNSGQHERRKRMDWRMANERDRQVLSLSSLTPLDPTPVAADGDLVALIEVHNTRLAAAAERGRQLATDRERQVCFEIWQEVDGAAFVSARLHIEQESWDILILLRRLITDREGLLLEMEKRLGEQYGRRYEEHEAAVASAEKRLAKERRQLERSSYATAGGVIEAMVAEDEAVSQASDTLSAARQVYESTAEARRGIGNDLREVRRRQREVFVEMAA
jgi:hypothetical protein